jgi:hypothetical protein
MSDFDKFFAEKLGEEGQFPRREKNWQTLSKSLDAFDTGLQHQVRNAQTYLRYWQVAAASVVLVAGWLTWKLVSVQNENAELRQEVAVLQKKDEDVAAAKRAQEETDPVNPVNFPGRSLSALGYPKEEKSDSQVSAASKKVHHKDANFNRPINRVANTSQSDFSDEKQSLSKQPIANNSPPIQAVGLANSENLPNQQAIPTLSELPTNALGKVTLAPQARVVLIPVLNKDIAVIADAQNIIKPVRPDSRFRAGVQLLAGMPQPQEEGVSLITGSGITAEYNIWKDFWVTASADWLRFDVSTTTFHPKYHPTHDPPPPPQIGPPWFQEKLVEVESAQRQQHFGLGLRYAFPVRFWVRPSIRVAHIWTRVSPEHITLKYQHPGWPNWPSPPPKYKVWESDAQIVGNTWRFGVGLEHETPNWVFGLWADYSKSFTTNDPSFDMLLFRGGIQYRFN